MTGVVEFTKMDGSDSLRLMRQMVMREGCVRCHGHLGFKVGDIRGEVSISMPLAPYKEATEQSLRSLVISHTLLSDRRRKGFAFARRSGFTAPSTSQA
ncbi:diguanylate cyclase [Candidatus Endoriftia persephone str. Guaymas]|nr:diguanylate cyclase [Candidatus Endoriftia persephone str. Guaymas]